ncbi:hypothetical protein, partial [Salinibacter sp.]
ILSPPRLPPCRPPHRASGRASRAAVGLGKGGYEASRADGQTSAKDLVPNAVGIGLAGGLIVL